MSKFPKSLCLVFLVLSLVVWVGDSLADEPFVALEDLAPPMTEDRDVEIEQEDAPLTLEELEALIGVRNVCGLPCGGARNPNGYCRMNCQFISTCFHGYCVYL